MRKLLFILAGLSFMGIGPHFVHSQPIPPLERLREMWEPKIHRSDLQILQLEMIPDPVWEGQRIRFEAILSNFSQYSARLSFFVKDRDEVVTSAQDIWVKPGHNRIVFPSTGYRFSRFEHCFTVEVDIERTRRPVDLLREFCARRTYAGWTLKEAKIGPLFVEDLEMFPDPARPGQEIRFRVRLRNDGPPLRADLRLQDRDQTLAVLNDVHLPNGYAEYYFPYTRYTFQRFDHCFTVLVDVERTPYRTEAAREFCARPLGWTLRP
ncbi:MAG: hypothetical protein N3G78_00545 [Desulfobacterota bacterium]|nr:hypothetical protein [Thermodesulfobacteriota bacterium]